MSVEIVFSNCMVIKFINFEGAAWREWQIHWEYNVLMWIWNAFLELWVDILWWRNRGGGISILLCLQGFCVTFCGPHWRWRGNKHLLWGVTLNWKLKWLLFYPSLLWCVKLCSWDCKGSRTFNLLFVFSPLWGVN